MGFKSKSPIMQGMLNNMSKSIFGRTVTESLEQNICVSCGNDTSRLEGSDLQEYELSGMCPVCFKSYGC